MRVVKSPFRISIGGGGTDLPVYCNEKGGDLIFATIDKYVYVILTEGLEDKNSISLEKTSEDFIQLQESSNEYLKTITDYLGANKQHLTILSASDVPSGTGLGSSGSFAVSLLKAFEKYSEQNFDNKELAETAFKIENKELGKECGKQDQYAAAYGGLNRLQISQDQQVQVSKLDIDEEDLDDLEANLMLFYTDEKRYSDDVLEDQKKEMEEKDMKVQKMDKIKSIGHQIREELDNGNVDKFGELLDEHWTTKKKFSDKITNPKINKMYNIAMSNGALGGKIVGAGGGGFLMLYVPQENQVKLKKELEEYGAEHMSFEFSNQGCEVVYED